LAGLQLAEFNKVLFKKDVSLFKKWAYLEGLATWVKLASLVSWMSAFLSSLASLTLPSSPTPSAPTYTSTH
jgi:hypothetical protein